MNEFESPSQFLLMFTAGIEETRRWLEMMAMAQEEFRALRAAANGQNGGGFGDSFGCFGGNGEKFDCCPPPLSGFGTASCCCPSNGRAATFSTGTLRRGETMPARHQIPPIGYQQPSCSFSPAGGLPRAHLPQCCCNGNDKDYGVIHRKSRSMDSQVLLE